MTNQATNGTIYTSAGGLALLAAIRITLATRSRMTDAEALARDRLSWINEYMTGRGKEAPAIPPGALDLETSALAVRAKKGSENWTLVHVLDVAIGELLTSRPHARRLTEEASAIVDALLQSVRLALLYPACAVQGNVFEVPRTLGPAVAPPDSDVPGGRCA